MEKEKKYCPKCGKEMEERNEIESRFIIHTCNDCNIINFNEKEK